MSETSRREFVKTAALSTGVAGAPAVRTAWGRESPSNRVNLGVIGFRGRGGELSRMFAHLPDARVAYLCDVDERLFAPMVAEVEQIGGYKPQTFFDLRKLLEKKDLDAVVIAAPDHWHALATIWACQAGKDVYVEKPVSHNLREGRKMVEAARKYNRIVQAGLNRRSEVLDLAGARFVQEARFGPAYRARAVIYSPRMSIGHLGESSIPNGVHWDLFLGPAPYREFSLNRFLYAWHYYWDFATTEMGNTGVHIIDQVRWALNKNVHPVKVQCYGGLYADKSDQETPNTQVASYQYADGTLVELDMTTLRTPSFGGERYGAFFYTPQGYIMTRPQTSANNWTTVAGECVPRGTPDPPSGVSFRAVNLSFPQCAYKPGPEVPKITGPEASQYHSHYQNFIDCIRSRKREDLHCEILEGHMSTALCHLANIAFRTGRTLTFDPASETFPGDEEANRYLTRQYRHPYVVPERV